MDAVASAVPPGVAFKVQWQQKHLLLCFIHAPCLGT